VYHGRSSFTARSREPEETSDRLASVPLDLGRRLHAAGAALPGELRRAVFEALTTGKPFPRALADASLAVRTILDRALEEGDAPTVRSVVPHAELLSSLPPGFAARLLAVPLRKDRLTGLVDVAVVDPLDGHLAAELAFHLGAAVRLIAAPLVALERALLQRSAAKKDPLTSTADYEVARASQIPPSPDRPPETQAIIAPVSTPQEDAVPLVRRSRTNTIAPSRLESPPRPVSEPPAAAIPLSRARTNPRPSTTSPIEPRVDSAPPVQMVVDFRAATRQERTESSQKLRLKLEPKRPPFASLTPILEAIDDAEDRTSLIEAILRGLATTSTAAALFAPRRGNFVGVGAIGEVSPERVREAVITPGGAIADAIAKNERLGRLDPRVDVELYTALGLERFTSVHVLIYPSFVAERAALLLVAMGMGDVIEATRRARVLSTAASNALERMLHSRER